MENKVFIDTNIFIAELNKDDSLHDKAKKIIADIERKNTAAVTSNFIISEAVTVLSQCIGKKTAVEFADFIYDVSTAIDIITVDRSIEIKALEYLKKAKNKNISFCDCTTLAILDLFNVPYLATFDKNFNFVKSHFTIML